ncbi:major facilitator superfamily domain-containing protein [Dichotomocladium elegans]|nr:major facilitator superfamily domain-containing protein [Dichotomocladium elegans]
MYFFCKLLYITVFALLSAAPPYLPLYYHNVLKFSSDQIGFVIAVAPFIESTACPVWAILVDKRPRLHGPVMIFTSCVGGLAVLSIMGIGHYVQQHSSGSPGDGSAPVDNRTVVMATCTLALAVAFFTLPNTALVDSAVMKILGPNKILYGEQRLWGSISTGMTVLLVGYLISITGNLDVMFYVSGISVLSFMCVATMTNSQTAAAMSQHEDERTALLRAPSVATNIYNKDDDGLESFTQLKLTGSILSRARTLREEANDALEHASVNLGLAVGRVLSVEHSSVILASEDDEVPSRASLTSPRVLCYLVTILLFGVVLSLIVNFLFLFLNEDLHMPASMIGWTGPLGAITELLCFCFAKQLAERYGVTRLVISAHLIIIFRCIAYTLLVPDSTFSFIAALLLQMCHGIGFAIFWSISVSEMDSFFPPEQRAVAQGVLGALHNGLGTGLGALIGGYIDAYLGSLWLFRLAAILCALSITVFSIGRLPRFEQP